MDELRQASAHIAAHYDTLPYEAPDNPALRPTALLGFGGVFGCAAELRDVLDLGCGTGIQLRTAGEDMSGRLVGVDLSQGNCNLARARLDGLGERVEIHQADMLDLTPQALGRFDLIYATGVVYAVPEPVRHHALRLIGDCLKPGGVVLVSHYGGAVHSLRSSLHRMLRAQCAPDLSPPAMIALARDMLAQVMRRMDPSQPMHEAARLTASLPDTTLFHEVFNPWCGPIPVRELDRALSAADVRFLGHVEAPASGLGPEPGARAEDADLHDMTGGTYHYALFGKAPKAPDLTAPHIGWSTVLRPSVGDHYRIGDGQQTVQIVDAPARQALAAIQNAPLPLLQAAPQSGRAVTLRLFHDLWSHRLVSPVRLQKD